MSSYLEKEQNRLEKLGRLLNEYAKIMSDENFDLIVDDLFNGGLSDIGFEELDDAVVAHSEDKVRKLAGEIFAKYRPDVCS
jgi:hypothetical protein